MPDLKTAIARFGADAKAKLSNPGEPEDQVGIEATLKMSLDALVRMVADMRIGSTDFSEARIPKPEIPYDKGHD